MEKKKRERERRNNWYTKLLAEKEGKRESRRSVQKILESRREMEELLEKRCPMF